MQKDIAISVADVYKDFLLPHEQVNSIKGIFTNLPKGSPWQTKETQHALIDISFEVKKGEFFGIVGRNGSGKSTLLKILAQIYQPTSGQVYTSGKLVPFIELGVGFNPELTGRENVYLNGAMLGFSSKEIDAMYHDIVSFAELKSFMDQKLKNYSSGMQVRLAFSMATRARADILLVDEVLAVGDTSFQRKCYDHFKKLKREGKTVVFVSHDMDAIREYCDRAILIEKSHIIERGTSSYVSSRYTKMFIEEADKDNNKPATGNRWGDRSYSYSGVKLRTNRLKPKDKWLQIDLTVKALRNIDRPIFGFSVKNAAYVNILGTNTEIMKIDIQPLIKEQLVEFRWTVPNIFNDGEYFIDLALIYDKVKVADWWEEAAAFRVLKEERTSHLVNPEMEFRILSPKGSRKA